MDTECFTVSSCSSKPGVCGSERGGGAGGREVRKYKLCVAAAAARLERP